VSWSEDCALFLVFLQVNLQLKHGFHVEEEKSQVL